MIPDSRELIELARTSVEVIASNQDAGGAYPASPAFAVYGYSWFRDGAFIADAMSRAGAPDSARRFFGWCARVLVDRRALVGDLVARSQRGELIARDEHLPTRYTLAGELGSDEWWDFQLDGYGAWMWSLLEHVRRHDDDLAAYSDAVELSTVYLCEFWNQPCFDWWEEHPDDRHPSTIGAVRAGLGAARRSGLLAPEVDSVCAGVCAEIDAVLAGPAVVDGHLRKSLGRTDVDASLISLFTPFDVIDPASAVAEATYAAIARDLAPDGVHRYLTDTFYGGGRWLVLAGFVGWHEARTGRGDLALSRLRWMRDHATAQGLLPEQVPALSLHPEWVPVWEGKWGPVATPLLWSHAMYISLADALGLLQGALP